MVLIEDWRILAPTCVSTKDCLLTTYASIDPAAAVHPAARPAGAVPAPLPRQEGQRHVAAQTTYIKGHESAICEQAHICEQARNESTHRIR